MNVNPVLEYRGARLTIRYCEQPPDGADPETWQPPSWHEALTGIPPKKHDGVIAKLVARRGFLADQGQLRTPDYWNTEGELPDGKRFYAIKADDLRAYGWFSGRHKGVFYISHFALKKGQKLAKKDARRVIQNWRQIEDQ
jgi:hypothetical protein